MRVSGIKRKLNAPEGAVQLAIIKYLKLRGYVVGKTKTHGVRDGKFYRFDLYTFRGFPDLTVFTNKELAFIEVKSKVGKQSEAQKEFQEMCGGVGVKYILARSVDDVIKALEL